MPQFTRVYLDAAGAIIHLWSQTVPIKNDPIAQPNIAESWDIEIEDLVYTEPQLIPILENRGMPNADVLSFIQDLKDRLTEGETRDLFLDDPRFSNLFVVRTVNDGLAAWEIRRGRELLEKMEKPAGQAPRFKAGETRTTPIRNARKRVR